MDNGVDITPLYRADAKAQMLLGAASTAAGVIVSLIASQGFQIVGFVLIAAGLIRLAYGAYRYQKYS